MKPHFKNLYRSLLSKILIVERLILSAAICVTALGMASPINSIAQSELDKIVEGTRDGSGGDLEDFRPKYEEITASIAKAKINVLSSLAHAKVVFEEEKSYLEQNEDKEVFEKWSKQNSFIVRKLLFDSGADLNKIINKLTIVVPTKESCTSHKGESKNGSVVSVAANKICVSLYDAKIKLAKNQTSFPIQKLIMHEIAHLLGANEDQAILAEKIVQGIDPRKYVMKLLHSEAKPEDRTSIGYYLDMAHGYLISQEMDLFFMSIAAAETAFRETLFSRFYQTNDALFDEVAKLKEQYERLSVVNTYFTIKSYSRVSDKSKLYQGENGTKFSRRGYFHGMASNEFEITTLKKAEKLGISPALIQLIQSGASKEVLMEIKKQYDSLMEFATELANQSFHLEIKD